MRGRPVPTNQWFRSFIGSQHGDPSFRLYTYPATLKPNRLYPDVRPEFKSTGMVISFPNVATSQTPLTEDTIVDGVGFGYTWNDYYVMWNLALVDGIMGTSATSPRVTASTPNSLLFNHSDWSATALWRDMNNPARYMKSTFGRGFVFTYFEFSSGVNARISRYEIPERRTWSIALMPGGDGAVIAVNDPEGTGPNYRKYLGIFAPSGSRFEVTGSSTDEEAELRVIFPNDSNRFLSVAVMTSSYDYDTFRRYAYNFITSTRAEKSVDMARAEVSTRFNFEVDRRRIGGDFSNVPLFTVWPHHYNSDRITFENGGFLNPVREYNTIRGRVRAAAASSFTTTNYFHGILPKLTDEIPAHIDVLSYLADHDDATFVPTTRPMNPYHAGKLLTQGAVLLPLMNSRDIARRDRALRTLRIQLTDWFTDRQGNPGRFFGFEPVFGGLLASGDDVFGSPNYADLHFHYGYFIYAAAILAMYDRDFASDEQFRSMVDLIILNIFNPYRAGDENAPYNSRFFPYLRHFDIFGGHSWASGFGGSTDNDRGLNQESSSEAMHAWSAIYLWGLITGNQSFIDLGMWGYVTEYTAIREYWFNQDGNKNDGLYTHATVGILWGGLNEYNLHWFNPDPTRRAREKRAIQVLPLTPSMLYLGFDRAFARKLHDYRAPNAPPDDRAFWWTIFARLMALSDPATAIRDFAEFRNRTEPWNVDEGSSRAYTLQFIHFFNELGHINTNYFADFPAFAVLGERVDRRGIRRLSRQARQQPDSGLTFMAYNPTQAHKRITFFNRATGAEQGSMVVPPNTLMSTSDGFRTFRYESAEITYRHNSGRWSVLLDTHYSNQSTVRLTPANLPPDRFSRNHISLEPRFEITNLPTTGRSSIHINFSGVVPPDGASKEDLVVLFSVNNGASWSEIPTQVNAATRTLIAQPRGSGIYALALRARR